ncbi:non-ribosomal peptide synthetase [Paenibacillus tengchongensis]|uniref:non-ribosomal peptide synthetase n=1 Tax=Paenibacillus tengchongensis TaxID=2608684 RepID=UPI00165285DA|nr:non-ribosomal peptide synthetase [Paenibacillus tengchongensis]
MKIKSTDIVHYYPLSPLQEGILYHYIQNPGSQTYFEQIRFTITGDFNCELFEKCFQLIVDRHDVFRTLFVFHKIQKPKQVVIKHWTGNVKVEDISNLSLTEIEEYLSAFLEEDRKKGFDLQRETSIRLSLIKLDKEMYEIVFSFHHIVSDAWSFNIVVQELLELYSVMSKGGQLVLQPVATYKNYIDWIGEQNLSQGYDFWKEYLAGYHSPVSVPGSVNGGSQREYQLEETLYVFDEQQSLGLVNLTKKYKITMSTLFQALWGILLCKYNNSNDAVFGKVVSGRPFEVDGVEKIVGLFINTVPARVRYEKQQKFTEVLGEIQKHEIESSSYHYCQLADIQASTELKRDLFNHIFIFDNIPLQNQIGATNALHDQGISLRNVHELEQTEYDLCVRVIPGSSFSIKFSYNARNYTSQQMQQIGEHLQYMSSQIVDAEDKLIKDIEICTEKEQSSFHNYFNRTEAIYHFKDTYQLFEEQVNQSPHHVALKYNEESISYLELYNRTLQLSSRLVEHKVKRGDIIGIIFERGFDMYVAILSVLRVGGVYLPIDPLLPKERMKYILNDSKCSLVLTHSDIKDDVEEYSNIVFVDKLVSSYRDVATVQDPVRIFENDLAYVIYTSGSTGNPKGVMVEHKAMFNFTESMSNKINIRSHQSILALTTMSFDIFLLETILPLTKGLTVYIANESQHLNTADLSRLIQESRVEILQATPTRLKLMLDNELFLQSLVSLKTIIVGGEPFPPELLNKLKAASSARIFNAFGPTEATVWATVKDLTDEEEITLGRPLDNIRVYILNEEMQLVPAGITGELYIAGKCLARGYLHKPDLTAEKFILHPGQPDELLYKTGDHAKWLPNGELIYAGRKDFQVKIRGYRIECGEIEHQIKKHEDVDDVVVTVWTNPNTQESYLLAYIATKKSMEMFDISRFLRAFLPSYMIPSYYVKLDQLPVTPNGKLDRNALSEVEVNLNTEMNLVSYLPENEYELKLQELWMEILQRDSINTRDSFFDLGGHSLKALTLSVRIHSEFHIKITLQDIFDAQNIKNLAKLIQTQKPSVYSEIKPAAPKDSYHLSFEQKRLFILSQFNKNDISYNLPLILRLNGPLDMHKLEHAFYDLVNRHEILRTYIQFVDGEPMQRIHHSPVPFTILKWVEHNENIDDIISSFVQPFDTEAYPLYRIGIVQTEYNKYYLLFDIHHLVIDGTSYAILLDELVSLYNGVQLSPIALQYKDYSEWQRNNMGILNIQKQEEYWLTQFCDEMLPLDLCTDFPRPLHKVTAGKKIRATIDKGLSRNLIYLASSTKTTPFMIFLATYNILLAKYTGREDIVVGSPFSIRSNFQLESAVGMFVNTLALRNRPSFTKSFIEFLAEVKLTTLEAFNNSDYPFEKLVERLHINRDLSKSPLFDTMFVYQNMDFPNLTMEDIEINVLAYQSQTSRFDITLTVIPEADDFIIEIEYCTALFEHRTIEKLYSHYIHLLESVTRNPELSIGQLEMLSEMEQREILDVFNQTSVQYSGPASIKSWFEAIVDKYPNNNALVFNEEKLTYEELNDEVNKIAHELNKWSIRRGDIVAVLADYSIEMVIAVLGIIKAGGVFLPIAHDLPVDRIQTILKNSNSQYLLVQGEIPNGLQYENIWRLEYKKNHIKCLTAEQIETEPNDLIYMIYTSGSTGLPKGVMIEQISLINQIQGQCEKLKLGPTTRHILLAKFGFDVSVQQILMPLLSGGTLYLASSEMIQSPPMLTRYIYLNNIDILNAVPTYIHALAEQQDPALTLSFRYIILGGEMFSKQLYEKIRRVFRAEAVFNIYGPTEATINTTLYKANDAFAGNILPIGKPLPNYRTYIFDCSGKLTPVGVPGELFIAGVGVARGYVNTEETESRFVEDPFYPSSRMYQTGDIAKWLPDGNIMLLGRKDDQIKIRGFRVEPVEIEKVILLFEGITDCVVIPKHIENRGSVLVAYYVCGHTVKPAIIRNYLSGLLPDYMIPSYFFQMDTFPLNINGKIDKAAFPSPINNDVVSVVEHQTAITDTERFVLQIWKELLHIQNISVHDNFFDLGGNSLLVISMYRRIEDTYPGVIEVGDIFGYPTIERLAELIKVKSEKNLPIGLIKMVRFPEDFFGTNSDCSGNEIIRFQLKDAIYSRLMDFKHGSTESLFMLLLSIFVYSISDLAELVDVTVQIPVESGDLLSTVDFQLYSFVDFNEYLQYVEYKVKECRTDKRMLYPQVNIGNLLIKNNNAEIAPFFVNDIKLGLELSKQLDFGFSVDQKAEQIDISCLFNGNRINRVKVEGFISRFHHYLLEAIHSIGKDE